MLDKRKGPGAGGAGDPSKESSAERRSNSKKGNGSKVPSDYREATDFQWRHQGKRLSADEAIVREHLRLFHELAARSCDGIKDPGYVQLTRIHHLGRRPKPLSALYKIGDVEPMVQQVLADNAAGHNCYVEARTVRPSAGGKRGDARATGVVFSFVTDSDSDTGRVGKLAIESSLTVETSPGNTHEWLSLGRAIPYEEAKPIGEAMRIHVGGDHCSGNPVQPYRIAGTVNWPNQQKRERGRVPVLTQIKHYSGKTYTADDLRTAFPTPQEKQATGSSSKSNKKSASENVDWSLAELQLPDDLKRLIQDGVPEGDRSDQFHHAVGWLKDHGWTVEAITALLEKYPDGIAAKYAGRIAQEVERSFPKLEDRCNGTKGGKDDDGGMMEVKGRKRSSTHRDERPARGRETEWQDPCSGIRRQSSHRRLQSSGIFEHPGFSRLP